MSICLLRLLERIFFSQSGHSTIRCCPWRLIGSPVLFIFQRAILETHTVGCNSGNEDSVETGPLYRQRTPENKVLRFKMRFLLGGSTSSGDNVVTPKSFTRVILETHTAECKSGNEDSVETDPLYRQRTPENNVSRF